jgi:hypothetical protein
MPFRREGGDHFEVSKKIKLVIHCGFKESMFNVEQRKPVINGDNIRIER